jgi:elongator complex protein 3
MYKTERYAFNPKDYHKTLIDILDDIGEAREWDKDSLRKIQTKYPKDGKNMFSKNDLIKGYRYLLDQNLMEKNQKIVKRIRMKPVRTISGVTPITVLTKPWPCPGNCIYCPNEPNMPKSYLESEPGAQRAAFLDFDPYMQTQKRIQSLQHIGHNTEKIELIVLGGSWSSYPENYQRWFIKRCFEAMNNLSDSTPNLEEHPTSWEDLLKQHQLNETAKHKCVGLSLETRPDLIDQKEVIRLRKLGCTKVQIGVQTLDDKLLKLNCRGHDRQTTKRAFELLRLGGFKIHAHWMTNLYGATPESDVENFAELWTEEFRPDELKIYPTAVIENTPLHTLYKQGKHIPYDDETLTQVVADLKTQVPEYCRITRIIRDIPSQDIVAGTKTSNLRQVAKEHLEKQGLACKCIRCREIRKTELKEKDLKLKVQEFKTTVSTEYFLSYVTRENKIAGFLRLSIPTPDIRKKHFIEELKDSATIREIHVYGRVVGIGKEESGKAQHLGIGKNLIKKAEQISLQNNVSRLAVISAIGTREYYRKRGFKNGDLYMSKDLGSVE